MKINVFDIKFKTNPNQPIVMTKDSFVLEVPDGADVNSYIAAWFNDNCDAIPAFDWEYDGEDDNTLDDEHPVVNDFTERIRNVLRRYFEVDDNGNPNPEYDESFEPQAAIDEIHEIIGDI